MCAKIRHCTINNKQMSLKMCVYKGCGNYYHNGRPVGNFTLFAFPKDAMLAQQWLELGRVTPGIPMQQCYMCSDHFDTKYQSITKKRTILIGQPVPFAYEGLPDGQVASTSTEENYIIDLDNDNLSININDNLEEQQVLVESTTANINEQEVVHFENNILLANAEDETVELASNVVPSLETVRHTKSKRARLQETLPETKEGTMEQQIEIIDTAEVSTFIFKGEEYVQMSKAHYLNEKQKLVMELQYYKRILKSIKSDVESLDL